MCRGAKTSRSSLRTSSSTPYRSTSLRCAASSYYELCPDMRQKTVSGWQEVLVGVAPSAHTKEDEYLVNTSTTPSSPRFQFVLSGPSLLANTLASVSPRYSGTNVPTGTRIEVSPRGYDLAKKIARFVSPDGRRGRSAHGAALFVDYGDARFFSDSIRVRTAAKLLRNPT